MTRLFKSHRIFSNILVLVLASTLLIACDQAEKQALDAPKKSEEPASQLVLTPALYEDLSGWGADDFQGFTQAFSRSCVRIMKKDANRKFGVLKEAGSYGDWQAVCNKFQANSQWTSNSLTQFFEAHFQPYQVKADANPYGLFTGYYEASLRGSRTQSEQYKVPLHARPDDLVMVHLGQFREDLKGVRIAGRVQNGTLKPYENREQIVSGKWPHNDQVLLWVDSAVDAFFVQIQGSGVVEMEEGGTMRIGYAGQNGHPYYAIGRELIKMGALTKENVSLQSIRKWLEDNSRRADEIMNTNKSYVFFREIKGEGPLGAEGVALTARRSLAIDRTLISYGLPLWVDIKHPETGSVNAIQKMMIAQDTGGAIRGPVRGDVYWGYGKRAEDLAGIMKSQGRYWVLLPKK